MEENPYKAPAEEMPTEINVWRLPFWRLLFTMPCYLIAALCALVCVVGFASARNVVDLFGVVICACVTAGLVAAGSGILLRRQQIAIIGVAFAGASVALMYVANVIGL